MTRRETMSAVRDLMTIYARPTILRARADHRAGRAVDLTYCESMLRIRGHSIDVIGDAQEYVVSCTRLPR